eukprot:SAG31_NODE_406_length_16063_cov_22.636056_3_plen_1079_part_00
MFSRHTLFTVAALFAQHSLTFASSPWGAQHTGSSLFGLAFNSDKRPQVVLIDQRSGNVSSILPVPIEGEIWLGPSTFDPPTQRYFFVVTLSNQTLEPQPQHRVKLVSVALLSGDVQVTELNCSNLFSLQYDPADAQLLGVVQHSAETWLASIDDIHGDVIPLVPVTVAGSGYDAVPGVAAFDAQRRRYYTLISGPGDAQHIVSLNTRDALRHQRPALESITSALDCNLVSMECERTTGFLLGIGTCESGRANSHLVSRTQKQPQLLRLNGTTGALELREDHFERSNDAIALYASAFDTVGSTFMSLMDSPHLPGSDIYSLNSEVFSIVCSSVTEHNHAYLTCDSGTITSVDFASFGTPEGDCVAFRIGWCHSSISMQIIETACLGMQSCSIAASKLLFGDPCINTEMRLSIQVTCSGRGARNGTSSRLPVTKDMSHALLDIFVSDAPFITGLNPGSSLLGANTVIQLSGVNFFRLESVECVFGGSTAPAAVVGNTITCFAPVSAPPGAYPLHLAFSNADQGRVIPRSTNSVPFHIFGPERLLTASPAMGPVAGGTIIQIASEDFVDSTHTNMFCRFDNVVVPARLEDNRHIITCVAPPAFQLPGRRLKRRDRLSPTYFVPLTGSDLYVLVIDEIVASMEWVLSRRRLPASHSCAEINIHPPWWKLGLLHFEFTSELHRYENTTWTARMTDLIDNHHAIQSAVKVLTVENITSVTVGGMAYSVEARANMKSIFSNHTTESVMVFNSSDGSPSRGMILTDHTPIQIMADNIVFDDQILATGVQNSGSLLILRDHSLLISNNATLLIDGASMAIMYATHDCHEVAEADTDIVLQTLRAAVTNDLQSPDTSDGLSRAAAGLPLEVELRRYDHFAEINGTAETAYDYSRHLVYDFRHELNSELDRVLNYITDVPNPFTSAVEAATLEDLRNDISDEVVRLSAGSVVTETIIGAVNQSLHRSDALGLKTQVTWNEQWAFSRGVENSSVDVSFSNNGRQFVSNNLTFTYYEPTSVLVLQPLSGPDSGGSTINVHGANFISGPGDGIERSLHRIESITAATCAILAFYICSLPPRCRLTLSFWRSK